MIQDSIRKVIEKQSLTEEEAVSAMDEIMEGNASPVQIASFLVGLRMKGETVEEIAGFARTMRAKAIRVRCSQSENGLVDTCGTGGDRMNTFNISTAAAFVAAGAGIRIAKHGNRAMSSKCGSADVLEALGVNIAMTPEQVGKCVDSIGIGFLFAQALHPAMRHAGPVRRELGVRTVFNVLGPLTNPAGAKNQVMGVFDGRLTELLAGVLQRLGSERAMVLHGLDGMDEITTLSETKVSELRGGEVRTYQVKPQDFGIESPSLSQLSGGTPEENAARLTALLAGEKGALRDIVLLNAAAAMVVGKKADTLAEGLAVARESVDSGAAARKLKELKEFTHDSG